MNRKQILAVVALTIASGAALAQTHNGNISRDQANANARNNYPVVPFVSTKTRAEVVQELKEAQAAGLIANGNNYPILPHVTSKKSRADVQQENAKADKDDVADDLYSGA